MEAKDVKIIYVINIDKVTPFPARAVNDWIFVFQKPDDKRTHHRGNCPAIVLDWAINTKIAKGSEA
jgi:hypothetical protein